MSNQKKILTEERLSVCRASRNATREIYYRDAEQKIGRAAVDELRGLYNIYDEKLYLWFASLWQPEIGGFYYATSGRDTKGFLPDIESTVQALVFTRSSGLTFGRGETFISAAPESMKKGLSRFVHSLFDPEDGYFYHPQWGKNIVTARRGRDLSWALQLLSALGEKTSAPTATERLGATDKKDNTLLPEHLRSLEAWRQYLFELLAFADPKKKSYWVANLLQSQTVQIKAAGQEYIDAFFDMVNERQREDNGLWEPQVNYASVNGMMKFSLIFTALGGHMNNAVAAINSAMDAAMSDEKIGFCCQFYNPLVTVNNILLNIKRSGKEELANKLGAAVIARAPEYISKTKEKILTCKCKDGGFSYNPGHSSALSQKAPVGLGENESDVNAASICSTGCMRNLCVNLGIPEIPLFSSQDGALFYDLIENARVHEKIYEKPDWFDDAIDPAKLKETY